MATSLHSQLISHYVSDHSRHEVRVGCYRIDAVDRWNRLVEIQCAPLGAIREKVRCLLSSRRVILVKPFAARKQIIRKTSPEGETISVRRSPTTVSPVQLFQELVHFGDVFPHPRLRLDILLTEQEEVRIPRRGRRSGKRLYVINDRRLTRVCSRISLSNELDLWGLLNVELNDIFTTADLATAAAIPRWLAQKAVYSFRRMGFLEVCGRHGNALVCRIADPYRQRLDGRRRIAE